ncbi:MAG: SEC-C domain-containing protein [Deltaproteobacteria bacterium]|nr:SEC-C domain-containing protein [Deltaproteobacteria bacterium]
MLDGPQAMNFALDLDLGLVEPDEFKGRAPLSSDWVEYVTAQVDGELLDELHNGWLHAKRFRRGKPNEIRWPVQDPAELVGWYALHPEDRRDCYLHEGRVFETEDLYCANPSCPCDEATLYFTEIADRDRAVPVGHLRVGLPNIQVLEWKPRGDQALLEQLWKTFQTRHRRAGERLMARKRHVIELARLRAEKQAPVVAPDRVGRNAPCPCGSGKKFKRCCAT